MKCLHGAKEEVLVDVEVDDARRVEVGVVEGDGGTEEGEVSTSASQRGRMSTRGTRKREDSVGRRGRDVRESLLADL
jgi:hypothetical protein